MGVKTAGVGHFQIPTAPAAGTSVTSGSANAYTTSAVTLIASTGAALYITGVHLESSAALAATYVSVQLMIGAAGAETVIGQYLVPLSTASTVALGYRQIYPFIPVANGVRISAKTADSVGAKATLVSLEVIAQSNVVDDGIAVGTVTTLTNAVTLGNVAHGGAAATLTLNTATVNGATTLTGNVAMANGLTITQATTNGHGITVTGNGTGNGINAVGGATSGDGVTASGSGTGRGIHATGGATSGAGMRLEAIGGSSNGAEFVGFGAGDGFTATGGASAGGDGAAFVAGGGVDLRSNITGNVTGNLSGSAGSVTGAVGSVAGAVASVTADVGITQAAADKVWSSAARTLTSFGTLVADMATAVWGATTRILTAGTNIVLAKGTGITGFNDIAATAIVSAGAITTNAGKVSGVILADTVTTYTGNTPQTGDTFARIGAAGAGLTALGDTRIANLDATVSSRSTLAAGAAMTLTGLYDAAKTAATQTSVDAIPTTPLLALNYTAPPTAAQNAAELLATAVDGTTTMAESVRLANATLGGKANGLAGTTAVYRDLADTKDRITATVDASGNRAAVIRNLT